MDYRKLGMEAVGSFIFILTACTTGDPLAIGLALGLMVYLGGNISGGHYNPAVSFAVFMRGKLSKADLIPYVIAQLSGGLAAALIAFMITHVAPAIEVAGFEPTLGRQWTYIHGAIAAEFIGTFFLAYAVLTVATTKKHANNQYYGLVIGGTVVVAATALGRYSGGAFNPAIGLSKSIVGLFGGSEKAAAFQWFWVYLIFPILGGWVAAIAFKFFHPDEVDQPVAPAPVAAAPAQAPLEQQPNVKVAQQPPAAPPQ